MNRRIVHLVLVGLISTIFPGVSQAAVELIAPAPLDEFLRKHLDLPATLADDMARAVLIRRARQEIADLLATEGYFSPAI